MNQRLSRSACVGLALLYGWLAGLGHGLHDHGCRHEPVAEGSAPACVCGHDHGAPAGAETPAGFGDGSAATNSHDCAACFVLSQIGVGYPAASETTLAVLACVAPEVDYLSPATASVGGAWAPRGPPLGLSA